MRPFKDHYKALQLAPSATLAEVKDQYRRLALEHHPDRGGDLGHMSTINDAYTTLADPDRRRTYDEHYRDFQLPTAQPVPAPVPAPAERPAPHAAPVRPAHRSRNVWQVRFWALAGLVAAGLIYAAGRHSTAATPQPNAAQASNLTAQQQTDQATAAGLKSQYDACNNSLTQQQNQIDSTNQAMQSANIQGNADLYNSMVPNQSSEVDQYNATASRCQQLRNQYNAAADIYNRSLQ